MNITLSEQQKAIKNYPSTKMVCALPCGGGKTIGTLMAVKGVKTILVVMPKFLKEEKTWEQNQEQIGDNTTMITISKEQFRINYKSLPKVNCLILDEYGSWACGVDATLRSKNRQEYINSSQVHENIIDYIKTHNPSHVYLLDATASAGKHMTLWATKRILGTLNPRLTEMQSFIKFRDMFHFKWKKGYSDIYLDKKDKVTKKTLADEWKKTGVFFDEEEKIEPVEEVVYLDTTPEQDNIIQEINELYSDPLVLLSRTYMAYNGAYTKTVFDDIKHTSTKIKISIPTEKEKWIYEFIKNGKQVIVFATYTSQIRSIENYLFKKNITVGIITGQIKNKSPIADKFRESLIQVLIVQSSICQGWQAPYCDTIIRASQPNRADNAIQQIGRINRPHIIKKQNYIYNLVIPKTSDEKAYKSIKNKEDVHWMTVEKDE